MTEAYIIYLYAKYVQTSIEPYVRCFYAKYLQKLEPYISYNYAKLIETFTEHHFCCLYAKYVEMFADFYKTIIKLSKFKHLYSLTFATLS